jgi:Flp pilus assembly protein TadG
MLPTLRRRFHHRRSRRSPGQALVELALVLPVLFGIILVLFQYAILFMSYLSLIHMTRDVGRWLAVHPNSQDSAVMLYVTKDMPTSVLFPQAADGPSLHCTYNSGTSTWGCTSAATTGTPPNGGLYVDFSPVCNTYNATTLRCMNGTNYSRPAGVQQTLTITYDAASRMFLPTTFRLGPFLNVAMPGRYQSYSYKVMVEPE